MISELSVMVLVNLLAKHSHPLEALLSPCDYIVMRSRIYASNVGTDDRGEFFWLLATKVRPAIPDDRPLSVDLINWQGEI